MPQINRYVSQVSYSHNLTLLSTLTRFPNANDGHFTLNEHHDGNYLLNMKISFRSSIVLRQIMVGFMPVSNYLFVKWFVNCLLTLLSFSTFTIKLFVFPTSVFDFLRGIFLPSNLQPPETSYILSLKCSLFIIVKNCANIYFMHLWSI